MVRIHHFSREKYDDIFLILGQVKFKGYCLKGTSPHPPPQKKHSSMRVWILTLFWELTDLQ